MTSAVCPKSTSHTFLSAYLSICTYRHTSFQMVSPLPALVPIIPPSFNDLIVLIPCEVRKDEILWSETESFSPTLFTSIYAWNYYTQKFIYSITVLPYKSNILLHSHYHPSYILEPFLYMGVSNSQKFTQTLILFLFMSQKTVYLLPMPIIIRCTIVRELMIPPEKRQFGVGV